MHLFAIMCVVASVALVITHEPLASMLLGVVALAIFADWWFIVPLRVRLD